MKLLVETTADFMLMDMGGSQEIQAHRPAVVTKTPFINTRTADGQLDVLAQLSDEATDAEFAKYWVESEDRDLAIAAFADAFSPEPRAQPKTPQRGKAKP